MGKLTTPPRSTGTSNLLSGVVGGLLVLVVGSILLATGVIGKGGDTKVVRETVTSSPARTTSDAGGRSPPRKRPRMNVCPITRPGTGCSGAPLRCGSVLRHSRRPDKQCLPNQIDTLANLIIDNKP